MSKPTSIVDQIGEILGESGRLAKRFDRFEFRPQQIAMAESVATALAEKRHCLVEAGTGVGKTVAYLVPSVLHAKTGKRVVVSTHTINLQGQLLNKDIPLVQSVLDDTPFKTVLIKGRGNYLCLNGLDHAAQSIVNENDPLFAQLREWARETETGDIAELEFSYPEWSEVCSNQDTCRRQECHYFNKCFYYRVRQEAATADIVLVNHSLFFSDLSVRMSEPRSGVLPKYDAVIFDEAHHLEDVASKTFGLEFSNFRVSNLLNRLRKHRDLNLPDSALKGLDSLNQELFQSLSFTPRQEFFLSEAMQGRMGAGIERAASELVTLLNGLNLRLSEVETGGNSEMEDRIDGYRRMCGRMRDELTDLFFRDHQNHVKWCDKPAGRRQVNCVLRLTPICMADVLKNALWGSVTTAVLTSATLANSGGFTYLRSRVGIGDAEEAVLGSPFDFQRQSLLYVPYDFQFPSEDPAYAEGVAERIKEILEHTGGRAFVLFTSYRMLNAVYDNLSGVLPYKLLKQGEKSNDKLLEEFRKGKGACLFGVHSFWEGVDVPGDALSCVIIDKLPFAVPDSPVTKARTEAITSAGGDWFREYAAPQAQIRLKQGFGRLIRSKTDTGIVCIMDSRLLKKFYGKEFLKYLPPCAKTIHLRDIETFMRESKESRDEQRV
ncbi:MAG: helicase C-terminal domain-containing protein [Armatimonadota bacterium]|nr:helicase C-terminal domain-containing protein [Armatimonadota bacterium]